MKTRPKKDFASLICRGLEPPCHLDRIAFMCCWKLYLVELDLSCCLEGSYQD